MVTVNCYGRHMYTTVDHQVTEGPATADPLTDAVGDGRRRRRDQNRHAVVEALLGFYEAGDFEPGIPAVASAAGLSPRSVFRYFDDLDDLVRAAIETQQTRLAPLWPLRLPDAFDDRVEAFVVHRLDLLAAMGPVGRLARIRSHDHDLVAAEVARVRVRLRGQVEDVFADQLDRLDALQRGPTLLAADVACSFEAVDLLQATGSDLDEVRAAMICALTALLGPQRSQSR